METVLYLTTDGTSPSVLQKLAGIRRFCSLWGWEAVQVAWPDSPPDGLPVLLRRYRPVGCVVDGVGNRVDLPPRLFRGVPVSYIGYMRGRTGNRPNFHFDTAAIAEAAFRELSTGRPSCYAAVGHPRRMRWPRQRVRAFHDAVRARGAECRVFAGTTSPGDASWDAFAARLVPWLAKLPDHCAVFAVSDTVAVRVARAARAIRRSIPRSLTLVSVDNFPDLCEGADPPISSIQLDFERAGFLAARALREPASLGRPEASRLAPTAPPILVPPLLVARRKSTSGSGRHEKFVLDAVEIIRREAADGLSAEALIARFPTSRRLFDLRFREATGHSVLDEILHVRLEKAFALLSDTAMSVSAIAHFCGFRSYAALRALFRRRTGLSMEEWRRRNTVRR